MQGLQTMSEQALLTLHSRIIGELKSRGVVRTFNNPVGDFAEWLVSNTLGLTLTENSQAGHDAIDADGVRYQIKSRFIPDQKTVPQLSALRGLDGDPFDRVIALLFDAVYDVSLAVEFPIAVARKYGKYRQHTNAHIIRLSGGILNDTEVKDITTKFRL